MALGIWTLIGLLAAVAALRFAIGATQVDAEHLYAALSAYLLAGIYLYYAEGETASGTKYGEQNGNVYKNTGSGWQQTQPKSNYDSSASKGWGQQEKSGGSSSFGGSRSGWQSRRESFRGSWSRGGGGGWGRR